MESMRCAAFAAVALAFVGCGERQFRAETLWHSDGGVTRTIVQHEGELPKPAAWESVREVDRVTVPWPGTLADLPPRPRQEMTDAERAYVLARGTFPSAADLPDHVRIEGPDKSNVGRLERSVAIHDLGLVTEYVWKETLTDVVTLDDMVAARREAATLVIDLVEATLARNNDYDTSDLVAWLRRDGMLWFEQSHAAVVEIAVRRPENREEALTARLIDIAARYGLVLRDSARAPLQPEERDAAIGRYLLDRVRETVRTAGGEPIDRTVARRLLHRLGFTGADLTSWEAPDQWKRSIEVRFGTDEAGDAKCSELTTRLLGVYGPLGPPRPFRYEMTVPGIVVETTGERAGANRVRWRFHASDAFPFGYVMSCRSLAPNEAAQRALLGTLQLDDERAMADYAALLRDDAELAAAMKRCLEARSLAPLDEYAENANREARAEALRMLLGKEGRTPATGSAPRRGTP